MHFYEKFCARCEFVKILFLVHFLENNHQKFNFGKNTMIALGINSSFYHEANTLREGDFERGRKITATYTYKMACPTLVIFSNFSHKQRRHENEKSSVGIRSEKIQLNFTTDGYFDGGKRAKLFNVVS